MNCDEARRHWNLYYDSEGDAESFLQVNEHLKECPSCAEWFYKESRLEDLIAQRLKSPQPDPELWESVLARAGLEQPGASRRRFSFWGLGALAASLLIAMLLWRFGAPSAPDLAHLTAEKHEQISSGALPLEFASPSDLEVEDYLQRRVVFPVRCPPRKDTGFIVQGAGVSQFASEQTAYVYGQVDGKQVSVFILARESLQRFPRQLDAVRREGVHRCREGRHEMVMAEIDRNVVLVVGETDPDRLLQVLRAYGSYPHVDGVSLRRVGQALPDA
jgi:hypothetical protein